MFGDLRHYLFMSLAKEPERRRTPLLETRDGIMTCAHSSSFTGRQQKKR